VETSAGTLAADEVLVAAGAWSGELASMANVRLPMQAGKGYNITVRQPEIDMRHSIYFSEVRIACTPFKDALRIAGTMEMSGINTELDTRRVDAIRRGADRVLKNWSRGASETTWAGMRPMTPDGLPVIGRAPGYDNLFFATGHAMMGVSLAPATAVVIADLMRGDDTYMDLAPFDPARFARRATPASIQPADSTARSA
jgi:D-amino-acid dehydrogenase